MRRIDALLVAVILLLAAAPAAWAADKEGSAFEPEPLFDTLDSAPDVIYLIANSSVVFGPDSKARSEEITFIGPVTVPKWPMKGYERRILPDGRQQIDIELTESLLTGESYMLSGQVILGEHPDLRSLGTITQPAVRVASNGQSEAGRASNRMQGVKVTFKITESMARTMAENQDVPWAKLVSQGIEDIASQVPQIKRLGTLPKEVPSPRASKVDYTVVLTESVAAQVKAGEINWDDWLHDKLTALVRERVDVVPGGVDDSAVIPSDFVVARKVLMTTAKGILYNETPVPVRGRVDAIPPVKLNGTLQGINVFQGMELPVELLDEKGNTNGWFYSKAHMAFALLPDAVQRDTAKGKMRFEGKDGKVEEVEVSGPVEIHHGATHKNGNGSETTDMEVIILALRGRSELLGGDFMIIESFSDREWLSRGKINWKGTGADSAFDLFMQVYTPSSKLFMPKPIAMAGEFSELGNTGKLDRGKLNLPLLGGTGRLSATGVSELVDEETERPVVKLTGFDLQIEPRQGAAMPNLAIPKELAKKIGR